MNVDELPARVTAPLRATTVYAEPVERDGVTVLPAARVYGGGGGGGGEDRRGLRGEGMGLGLIAQPVGAFVIKDGEVWWQPAVDVNRLVATLGAIAVAGVLAVYRLRRRSAG